MKKMIKFLNKVLIALKLKKQFIWTPSEFEVKKLEKAYPKIFKSTIDSLNKISKGGYYKINLSYEDIEGRNNTQQFDITLISDNEQGLKFKITLPNLLNIGRVKYKESYGLTEELLIENKDFKFFIPENSVIDFNTKFPAKPQILEGRFKRVVSSKENEKSSFCRFVIPTKDNEMFFPTSILEYDDNHMKFDNSNWDRQSSLMGIPFMSTKGMFVELSIKGSSFHFYGVEQLNSQVIDSLEKITVTRFKEISYAIRLCFAFLSGRFYKAETFLVTSEKSDFFEISHVDYNLEESSILTENQIINPTFFFGQYSEKDKETQDKWKPFHTMFDKKVFSIMCEKVLDSPEFMRTLELIINAGNINNPVLKGAMYSVCIETMTELLKSKNEESFKPIPKKRIWKQFHKEIKSNLEKIKEEISEDGYKILTVKIDNLNGPTNRDKLEKPFKLVGIELSKDDLEILEQRNNYLHGGHPNDDNWATKSNINALKLHYIIGWLILKHFNYSGHYINIAGWYVLNNYEAKKIMKNLDFSELGKVMTKVREQDFETVEQLDEAKRILDNFDKFNKAALELEELIKII